MVVYFSIAILGGYFYILTGPIISMIMGFYYSFLKSTAPDGEKYYEFDVKTRQFGLFIIPVSIIAFISVIIFKYVLK
jgi:hypothetical protein